MSQERSDIEVLSQLLFAARQPSTPSDSVRTNGRLDFRSDIGDLISNPERLDLEALKSLAMTNHVIVRSFEALKPILQSSGRQAELEFVESALQQERARITHALAYLDLICRALDRGGCKATVIKSLDHWPDLGSDLDLFTDAQAEEVVEVMRREFQAKPDARSWGDRLANKWNFVVPGLPELVEVHVGRLGQTGEQTAVTRSVSARGWIRPLEQYSFRVAAPEDRIVISTLQRMYRHFYIRLCDVIDNAELVESGQVDFNYLHSLGSEAGLWEGIATYLNIVSGYVEAHRGFGIPLPSQVTAAAKFGSSQVQFRKDFLRVPILPHSVNLYAGELKTLLFRGDIRNTLRLSLLPGLATAAAVEYKLTGSDKGIW